MNKEAFTNFLITGLAQKAGSFGLANSMVLGVYLALLVAMGIYFARRASTVQDFFLAGGRMPWWAAGLSIFATMLSAITYLSIPATAYASDWTRFLLNMGIPLIAPIVIFFFLPFYRKLRVISAYEYLENRFDVSLRLLGSASFILFQLGRMGIVVLLPALALSAVTGLNLFLCIALMGLLSTLYTVLGGMEAVIWTDVIQVVVLVGGALAALGIIVADLPGGFGQIIAEAAEHDKWNLVNPGWDLYSDSLFVILLGMVFVNLLPYTTDQAVVQRYMTTPTEQSARSAIWTGALFAAAMSSLDSSIHSITTAVTTDFFRRFQPDREEKHWLSLARRIVLILGILGTASAMLISTLDLRELWSLFLDITGLFLGTLGGLFILGVFTRRTTPVHAWIGALASAAALAYCTFFTSINGLLFGAIGTLTCVGMGWLSSWIVRRKQKKDVLEVTI